MFGSKRRIKPMTLNSINGYASEVSLVCLFLVLQIVSFLSLSTLQNVYLLKANQQNILELSIVDHAKHMIHHNNRIKLCHTSEKIIKDKDERIQNIDVVLITVLNYTPFAQLGNKKRPPKMGRR